MKQEEGHKIIKEIVDEWSKVYINQVFFNNNYSNSYLQVKQLRYTVEFSKPAQTKPIPEGTVKVYFTIVEKATGDKHIEFNFENESLKHNIDQTMRTNMFEKWIDRVLEKKLKVKGLLHLGTEYEYTRTVDDKGKIIDPFAPKFDMSKAFDLSKEIRKSQKVNVESPRFQRTLQKALIEMFKTADKDNSGNLDYEEFFEAFKNLSYGLNDNDIHTLIALADTDGDGVITWEEFVPVGIEAIKTFFARNKAIQRLKTHEKDIKEESLREIYMDEIKKTGEILEKRFLKEDETESGFVSVHQLKSLLKETNQLTFKEVNILLKKSVNGNFEYKHFNEFLYQVRFELARSRYLDTNLDQLQEHFMDLCRRKDTKKNGKIPLPALKEILTQSKKVNLTPFQIQTLLGLSEPDQKGWINYKSFSFKAKFMIEELFSLKSMLDKSKIIREQNIKFEDTEDVNISKLDLFKIFKKYDRNMNGSLDTQEYIKCLNEACEGIMTSQEIISLSFSADLNGDGDIDYEEFMKHFQDLVKLIRFHKKVQDSYCALKQAIPGAGAVRSEEVKAPS